jgi:hypothetical protein
MLVPRLGADRLGVRAGSPRVIRGDAEGGDVVMKALSEPCAEGSPIPPLWILVCGGFVAVVSVLAVAFDWSGVVSVLAVVPGVLGIEVARGRGLRRRGLKSSREAPQATWRELAVPFVPISLVCLGLSFLFDTTRWAWLAPIIALMMGGSLVAEHLAWRRASGMSRP